MAVLLMVFAALLGSTFITVVALNLSQTSRNESKRDAELAARAAIEVTNAQLTNSTEGENWRPEMINPPPPFPRSSDTTARARFDEYYSAVEQAQGWIRTAGPRPAGDTDQDGDPDTIKDEWYYLEQQKRNNGDRVFVKFPDPRDKTFSRSKTPSYLVEVSPVTTAIGGGPGSLRIEVIGRADDDDAAFSRSVVYKGTSRNGGPLSFTRYDSNYDLQRDKLRVSNITQNAPIAPTGTVTLEGIRVADASLFQRGQTIIVTQGNSPESERETAVIAEVVPEQNIIRVSQPLDNEYLANSGAQVRAASTLMTVLPITGAGRFNADGDPSITAGSPARSFDATLAETTTNPVGFSTNGMYFGSGVSLEGSGLLQLAGSATADPADDDAVLIAGQVAGLTDQQVKLRPSDNGTEAAFPVSGANRTKGVQTLVRDDVSEGGVRTITPPRLEGKPGQFSRYLELTKLAALSNGSQYGYGPGVYIDNREDIEKIIPTGGTAPVAMPIRDMHRLWQRKIPAGSQESGVRGWVNTSQEFAARGAFIELKGDTIVVTRDSITNASKTWKDRDGKSLPDPRAKTYRMMLNVVTGERSFGAPGREQSVQGSDPAFNGVIYADGNLRVRGWINDRDITIVSMGNVYIEGSVIRTGQGRVALLAKKNVVLNPTRFIPRVAGAQDAGVIPAGIPLVSAASGSTAQVSSDAGLRVGDMIKFGDGTRWRMITGITPSPTATVPTAATLTFEPALTATVAATELVHPLSDPAFTTGTDPYYSLVQGNGKCFRARHPLRRR
jgi:hypothetical protein